MPSSPATLGCLAVLSLYVMMCDGTWCEQPGVGVPIQGPGGEPCQESLLGRVEGVVSGVIDYLHDVTCQGYRQLQHAFQPYRQQQPPLGKMKAMLGGDSIRKVMADFDIGIHNAARKVWPGARIFGCRFHLTQSWYRKIQNLGLVTVYRNTKKEQRFEQESTWLRHIFGLPYLSHDEVGTSFAEDFISNLPTNPKIQKFADYLLETYVSEDAMFPPEVWASFSTEPVTTNPCESFHSHFKKKFYEAHPDVYSFTKQLLSTHTFVYIKLQSTMEPPKPSGNKVYRERRMRLLEAKEQYMEGHMIRREYIAAASCNCATV